MGKFNSSLTRIQPVFEELLNRNPDGDNWLARLLDMAGSQSQLALQLATNSGKILPRPSVQEYFERRVAPPHAFLKWLVQNPQHMKWPKNAKFGAQTQSLREKLFNSRDKATQLETQQAALAELAKPNSAQNSRYKWWAFEGFTAVDCLIETDKLILFIEGKRTEVLSPSTSWFPQRNQLSRNLESAREMAGGKKEYGVLLITEKPTSIAKSTLEEGWPHLTKDEKEDLHNHYLGTLQWEDVCSVTGINFAHLPHSVP